MRILILDDNNAVQSALGLILQERWPAAEISEGLQYPPSCEQLSKLPFDLVLLNWELCAENPQSAVKLQTCVGEAYLVIMSSDPTAETASTAIKAKAFIDMSLPPEKIRLILEKIDVEVGGTSPAEGHRDAGSAAG